jgi:protein phosphatase methylesterase 1
MIFDRVSVVNREAGSGSVSLAVGICGEASNSGICLLFLHGAGSSKETWHNQIKQLQSHFLLIAPDMRSHGASSLSVDLSLTMLVDDVMEVINSLHEVIESRKVVLVGHSVGGSIAVQLASRHKVVSGVVVIDLIEETALESLVHMKSVLNSWPSSFPDVSDCVRWSTDMHRPQSPISAEVSIPPLVRLNSETSRYEWVTPLASYERDWVGWFTGFDSAFLGLEAPHCMLLASAERLDGKMCAAHMQGKFELHVVQGGMGGHFVQEDAAAETLGILINFLKRREILTQKQANEILQAAFTTNALPMTYRSPFPPAMHR